MAISTNDQAERRKNSSPGKQDEAQANALDGFAQSPTGAVQRALADRSSLQPADVLQLQRSLGNRATARLLANSPDVQAKLELGPAGDQYEQEADRTARQVVRSLSSSTPAANTQREELDEEIQAKPISVPISRLQRQEAPQIRRAFMVPQRHPGESSLKRQSLNELATAPYPELTGTRPSGSANTSVAGRVVQRAWDTYPLDYATISNEKTQGQIRTKAWKTGGSLKTWVKKFYDALDKRNEKDALSALNGLKQRLEADQKLAAQGKLKAPKGVKDFNKVAAQQQAATFFAKWIQSVQDHIDYAANAGDWITDFREKYINAPKAVGVTPKQAVLDNLANVNQATDERLKGVAKMWDLGGVGMQQRMTDLMGGVSDLARMSSMEYFLEQVSPVHVGYGRVLNMFDMWTTGVLYHSWTYPWETWMPTKSGDTTFGNERIIDSYDVGTRAQYQLTLAGKQIRKADNNPLVGDNIYVLTKDNVWYASGKVGPVHHSSFMQGAPVKCAGHLFTDGSGNLTKIDNNSGHYAPDKTALKRAASVLKSQMDTSDVQVDGYASGLQSIDDFLAS